MPSATIVITAETPMIMPSIVSAVRILLRASALKATRSTIRNDIGLHRLRYRGQLRQLFGGSAAAWPPGDRSATTTVTERHDPRAVLRDVGFVRDQHDGDAALLVQALESPITSMLVRVSRLPVGSSARRIDGLLISARAIATRCCWPPDSWLG